MSPLSATPSLRLCHSPHGECGLKYNHNGSYAQINPGHSPHGECGLKWASSCCLFSRCGHSPHGECGLKCNPNPNLNTESMRHSPHGECGLKSKGSSAHSGTSGSLPTRGVWIEIAAVKGLEAARIRSLPTRGVWIEISCRTTMANMNSRHSPHGECGLKLSSLQE